MRPRQEPKGGQDRVVGVGAVLVKCYPNQMGAHRG